MVKKLSEWGAQARRGIGEESDRILLDKVRESPGLTIYELSKELEWSKGRVQGSVNRLVEQKVLRKKKIVLNDRILTKILPEEYKEPEVGVVEINYKIVEPQLWKTNAFAGAMDRVLIKIVPEEMVDVITEKAFFYEKIPVEHRTDTITFKLPQSLRDFYRLDHSVLGVSTNIKGDTVFLTIEGTTAEVSQSQNPTDDILTSGFKEVPSMPDDFESELVRLGLSPVEAKLYMYLLRHGQKTSIDMVKHVTESLNMPRTEFYSLLSSLQHKGLVYATLEHPIKCSAVPLSKALQILRSQSSLDVNVRD
jgi:predicted transcriptional regulator